LKKESNNPASDKTKKQYKKQIKIIKNRIGRPTKMTEDIVGKIEEAASYDCSVSEICLFANICRDTYYEWIKKDKQLSDRITALRNTPVLIARQELIKSFKSDGKLALEYLERKLPNEFGKTEKIKLASTVKEELFLDEKDRKALTSLAKAIAGAKAGIS